MAKQLIALTVSLLLLGAAPLLGLWALSPALAVAPLLGEAHLKGAESACRQLGGAVEVVSKNRA